MKKPTHINRPLSKAVIEARAGIIPESDYILIELEEQSKNLASIGRFLQSRKKSLRCTSDHAVLREVIAYLRLYCETNDLDFDEIKDQAYSTFLDEIELGKMYNGG